LNGSINRLRYENGEFSIRAINDISYMERGKSISDHSEA
jgi:probable phosphoglycerate mutase